MPQSNSYRVKVAGLEFTIPAVWNGERLSRDQALKRWYVAGGRPGDSMQERWLEPQPVATPQPADDFAYDANFQAAGPVRPDTTRGSDKADRKLLARALAGATHRPSSLVPPNKPVGPPTQLPMLSDRAVQEAIASAPKEAKPLIRQLAMAMAGGAMAGVPRREARRGAKT